MSVEVMAMVFKRYPVGGGEMMLALALADHAHDDGTCIFPAVKQLAKKTRQSERTVQYQLRKMEEMSWLIVSSAGGRGAKDTREWRINPEWIEGANLSGFDDRKTTEQANKGAKIAPLNEENKGAIQSNKGATGDNKGAIAIAPESSVIIIEPSEPLGANLPASKITKIGWDVPDKMFKGISAEKLEAWEKAFPSFDVEGELTRIDLWYARKLEDSPKFKWKNAERGIHGWLSRAFSESRRPRFAPKQTQQPQARQP